ncbi:hypothetical protein OIU76_006154 [Salix suchowensis]|nr:hypothetical protein OIU76_006154 [Salix suchowensis]
MVEAEETFKRMKELGCKPDGITYRTLSDGYCKVGNVEEAFKVKEKMEKEEFFPSIEMYNSLIVGIFSSKKISKLIDLLAEMYTKGLSPNVVTYGALIAGWCDQGRLDKAFGAYFEMIEKGFAPNVIICSKIVSSLYRCGRIDEANMLLQKMVDFDLVLDHRCDVEEAMRLLNEMKASNVDQTIATFSELVEDCIQHGDVKKMSKLHNMMHMACPSAGVTSHKQMGLSELSNVKEMLDAGTDGGLMVQFVTHLFYIALWFQMLPALTILDKQWYFIWSNISILNDDEVQLLYILVEEDAISTELSVEMTWYLLFVL